MNRTLSLPSIAPGVPQRYAVHGPTSMSAPLAIALIKLGLITNADLTRSAHETDLVQLALTRWWSQNANGFTLFNWALRVQTLHEYGPDHAGDTNPWFCLTFVGDIPRFSLALRVGELEGELEGFGQTVLAVLEDAFDYLPVAWTLGEVLGMASWVHWMGENDETLALEEWADVGEDAPDIFTRAEFFNSIPEWAALPRRVRTRAELEIAASSDLGKNIIKTCDAISTLVNSPGFILPRHGARLREMQMATLEACAWIRWTDEDVTGRIVDDFIDEEGQTGEYVHFIGARPVKPTVAGVRRYLAETENMLQMALLVEQLMIHLGAPQGPRTLVEVFAGEAVDQLIRVRV